LILSHQLIDHSFYDLKNTAPENCDLSAGRLAALQEVLSVTTNEKRL
jgi:hypothetical protein